MITIFDYQNYRHFLSDYLIEKKQHEKGFSQREILKKMGITSSGFLSNVISGRNNLTTTQITSITSSLKLNKLEAEYFEVMAHFTQAKTLEEKNTYFSRMVKLHKAKFKGLKPSQLSLFAQWHYAVIRELIYYYDFKDDYKALAKMVDPPITPQEAKEAITELEKIGLIEKDAHGVYRQKQGIVTTGDEISSFQVAQFQKETMKQAERALDAIPSADRDMSVMTLKLSQETFRQMKSEIQLFRKKLLRMEESDINQERVYQCNINFFPVTRKREGQS